MNDKRIKVITPDKLPAAAKSCHFNQYWQVRGELNRSHIELQKLIEVLDVLRDKEQKRLAQEMHDDLGQLLAAMKIDLTTLQKSLPSDIPRLSEQVSNLHDLVDAMVTSVRRIITDLPPNIMGHKSLFNALSTLTANFERRHGIIARLEAWQPEPDLGEQITTPLYRIVQEALSNVAKHAHATSVTICIRHVERDLILTISDDGKGMTACEMQKEASFGLISMRERIKALGGEIKIDSRIGSGTMIRLMLPIDSH